jgi:hypothetical protein
MMMRRKGRWRFMVTNFTRKDEREKGRKRVKKLKEEEGRQKKIHRPLLPP